MPKLLLALIFAATGALAQDYPAREIRSVCNFAAGSGADILVRYYSDALAKLTGRPVIVENKPGAQGLLATDFVAKSRPDGYTILITPASSTLAAAPHLFRKMPFDPLKDFETVTTLLTLSFTIAVDASGPLRTVDDLVARLRAKPGNGFYGTQSNSGQISAELFKEKLGLKTTFVPFKATGDAFTNLLGGNIDFMSVDSTWSANLHRGRCASWRSPRRSATAACPTCRRSPSSA